MFGQRIFVCVAAAFAIISSSTGTADAQSLRGRGLTAAAAQAEAAEFHAAMLKAVNEERAKQSLGKLCYNKKLQAAAQLHSKDQAQTGKMTHTGSDGSSVGKRVTAQQFQWSGVAENVAAGQTDVASVMSSWMKSDGHRRNIMSADYKFFGMGYAYNANVEYKHYWTQNFAAGSGESCDSGSNEEGVMPTPAPKPTTAPADKPTTAPADKPTTAPAGKPTTAPAGKPTSTPASTPAPVTTAPAVTQSPKQVTPVTSKPAATKKRDCNAK